MCVRYNYNYIYNVLIDTYVVRQVYTPDDNMYKHKKVNQKITTCEYTQSINYTTNVFNNNNVQHR